MNYAFNPTTQILVIGATGFIGKHVTRALIDVGHSPRVFVRSPEKLPVEIAQASQIFQGDLLSLESLSVAVSGCHVVLNCSGLSADWGSKSAFDGANEGGIETMCQAILTHAPEAHLVHLSTTDVYGYPDIPCDETTEPSDVGLIYNASKIAGEKIIFDAMSKRGLKATVLRPATVWGPESKDFVVELARLLELGVFSYINKGRSKAGLLYVENLAHVMLVSALNKKAIGETYNVRDPYSKTWREYIDTLAQQIPRSRKFHPSLPGGLAYGLGFVFEKIWAALSINSRPLLTRHLVQLMRKDQDFLNQKVLSLVGADQFIDFEEGMKRTHNWMRKSKF